MKAIIVDLDGTLVNSPFVTKDMIRTEQGFEDWIESTKYSIANEWCKELVQAFVMQGYKIIFLTARLDSEKSRQVTNEWLMTHGFFNYELIMRPKGDLLEDDDSKRQLYYRYIAHKYSITLAVDDKECNIMMWRSLNIPALHCADH